MENIYSKIIIDLLLFLWSIIHTRYTFIFAKH